MKTRTLCLAVHTSYLISHTSSMSYQLAKNILATITYYDVLDFPLSAFEIWKHLIAYERDDVSGEQGCRLGEVIAALGSEQITRQVEERNGFHFLRGREQLVTERIRSDKVSVCKLRRMRRLARWMQWLPFLRMIGATGSLSMKHSDQGSDWDMFVVLASGKIWMGRTILTGFLQLIGKRRHGNKVNDRACLNYFVTEDHLEIGTKDLYSAHEYRYLIPLVNFRLFQRFELQNRWIRRYQPNFFPTTLAPLWNTELRARVSRIQAGWERFFNVFHLERWLSGWQTEKIRRNPKSSIEGGLIQANDRELIFLPHPRGPRVFEQFKERLSI